MSNVPLERWWPARRRLRPPDRRRESRSAALRGLRGNVTLAKSYEPYGTVLTSTGTASSIFGYAGEQADIDAEIVQTSYFLKGRAYRNLGDNESAITAFQQARELLKQYRVGSGPEVELAEIFIEQGRLDEAIEMCQEVLARASNWNAKQVLARALALKESKQE